MRAAKREEYFNSTTPPCNCEIQISDERISGRLYDMPSDIFNFHPEPGLSLIRVPPKLIAIVPPR